MEGNNESEFYEPLASECDDQQMYQQVQNVNMPSAESLDMDSDITDFFEQVSTVVQATSVEDQMTEEKMILLLQRVHANKGSSEQAEEAACPLEQAHDTNILSEQLPATPQHLEVDHAGEQDRLLFLEENCVNESPSEQPPSLTNDSSEQSPLALQIPVSGSTDEQEMADLPPKFSFTNSSSGQSPLRHLMPQTSGNDTPQCGLNEQPLNANSTAGQASTESHTFAGNSQAGLINQSLGDINFYGRAPPVSQTIMRNPQAGLINQSIGNVNFYAPASQASQNFTGNPQTGLINQAIDNVEFYGQVPPESHNSMDNPQTGLINQLSNYVSFPQDNSQAGLINQPFHYINFPQGNSQTGLINQLSNYVSFTQDNSHTGLINQPFHYINFPQGNSQTGLINQLSNYVSFTQDNSQTGLINQPSSYASFPPGNPQTGLNNQPFGNVNLPWQVPLVPQTSLGGQQPNSAIQGFAHVNPGRGDASPKKPQRKLLQPRPWDQLWRAQKLSSGGHPTSAVIYPVTKLHDWMFRIFAIHNDDLEVTTDRDRQLRDKNKLAAATRFMNALKKPPQTTTERLERLDIGAALDREKMYLEKREKAIVAKERLAERKAAAVANTAA